jgi:hypothetical protein
LACASAPPTILAVMGCTIPLTSTTMTLGTAQTACVASASANVKPARNCTIYPQYTPPLARTDRAAMTLRLASVFRHVLAHSSRPLTSVRDEMEFLRTYLYIEEARFGDRLHLEIDMAPEVAGESIPL